MYRLAHIAIPAIRLINCTQRVRARVLLTVRSKIQIEIKKRDNHHLVCTAICSTLQFTCLMIFMREENVLFQPLTWLIFNELASRRRRLLHTHIGRLLLLSVVWYRYLLSFHSISLHISRFVFFEIPKALRTTLHSSPCVPPPGSRRKSTNDFEMKFRICHSKSNVMDTCNDLNKHLKISLEASVSMEKYLSTVFRLHGPVLPFLIPISNYATLQHDMFCSSPARAACRHVVFFSEAHKKTSQIRVRFERVHH